MQDNDLDKEFIYNLFSKEEKLKKGIKQGLIVDLVDSLLFYGIKNTASDVHIEQTGQDVRIRYRIDGVLYDQSSISKEDGAAVISRLKILSSLDISEKRIPQDGKFRVLINKNLQNNLYENNNYVDLRISTFPSIHGEKMVVRILDRAQNNIKLGSLGMGNHILKDLYSIIDRPQGFFLVTGPTGSGKTTTLYSILSHLNSSEKNIITMEDPVEYNLDGITQSQINEKSGFTFEKGLRSILRQDPDIVMVGEIRDKQTAQIAIEAALTGHLVLSTLHTNDSIGAVTRLIDMGVEPFLINASLSGVLAQRLVRKLCSYCKQEDFMTIQENQYLKDQHIGLDQLGAAGTCYPSLDEGSSYFKIDKLYRPVGCLNCLGLGYKSRIGVFELLKLDDNIRDLILTKGSSVDIKNYVISNDMKFLINDGINKVKEGLISLEEFFKIINL
ncbi:MAG: GspE/PulE family protein [bacterium]